eukprot:GHVT01004494.1.p1 GENE.GHVT01004494.1~~GHVT01004494.1.p1  ORF type:complete len:113 (+),score=4.35 GHVT01004494.1:136-474(+)
MAKAFRNFISGRKSSTSEEKVPRPKSLTDKEIHEIAPQLKYSDWETLAQNKLGLTTLELTESRRFSGADEQKFVRNFLQKWRAVNPQEATKENLQKTIEDYLQSKPSRPRKF